MDGNTPLTLKAAQTLAGKVVCDALELTCPELLSTINVKWNARITRVAGRAWYHKDLIEFSSKLLPGAGADVVRWVAKHEVAHLVAFQRHGSQIKDHGREWRGIMRELRAKPSRTLDLGTNPHVALASDRQVVYCQRCGWFQSETKSSSKKFANQVYTHDECKFDPNFKGFNLVSVLNAADSRRFFKALIEKPTLRS